MSRDALPVLDDDSTHAGLPGGPTAAVQACDGCGASDGEVLMETSDRRFGLPGGFTIVRCAGCGLVRTSPAPSDPGAYYPTDDYYSYQPPRPPGSLALTRLRVAYGTDLGQTRRSHRLIARLARDRMTPGLPPGRPGSILDVGCGSGTFLLGLEQVGWDVHGLEIDEEAVCAAQSAGLDDVRAGELLTAGLRAGRFDAVRFWHCLEHVSSPTDQLRAARRVLRPGGSLTIGVPNFASLAARVAGERWFSLDVPRHLWHFEPSTLRQVVEGAGFAVERLDIVSTSTATLGTLDNLRGRGERLVNNRLAWHAALPAVATLDRLRLGDGLHLVARAV